MKHLLLALTFILIGSTKAQVSKTKVPSYFGVEVKSILPTQYIGNPVLEQSINGFNTTFTQKPGYSFGGVVRVGLTKLLALETGLHLNHRNFDIDMSVPSENSYATNSLSFITYDLPINGLVYIRLAEQWFMNTAIGASISYNPTNVGVKTLPGGPHIYKHTGLAQKVIFEFGANVGFEFRTKKAGFYYLGGGARVPMQTLFYLKSQYGQLSSNNVEEIVSDVDGSYLSISLKYFFPDIKNKGTQFKEGPIEQ